VTGSSGRGGTSSGVGEAVCVIEGVEQLLKVAAVEAEEVEV
jgi:hypothetical protein